MKERLILSWSGGKDSAMALYELNRSERWQVAGLLTTVTQDYDRISMHGVRCTLLEKQAASLGLTLTKVLISKDATNAEYESRMKAVLEGFRREGIFVIAFGDIFLRDIKKYREDNLAQVGMAAVFPIWGRDTAELARSFIDLGFEAVLTCVDLKTLEKGLAGRLFDRSLLSDLPAQVDPCGENGEFHSFVYDGPIFRERIECMKGETVVRDERFCFCDLLPLAKEPI
jgi:uncharacterized protein (TIGR00290 family)